MKLSTRPRYGVKALPDIATHSQSEPIRLKEIARRQDVSLSYLEHIIGPLNCGGILRSTRGPVGGVSLLGRPEDVPLAEVMHLLEGPMTTLDCVLHPGLFPRSERCVTRTLSTELAKAMQGGLCRGTLDNLTQSDDSNTEGSCVSDAFRPLCTPISRPELECKKTGGEGS